MIYPLIEAADINDKILLEGFTLNEKELEFIKVARNEYNLLGLAVFYKTFIYIGYPPRTKENIPLSIINWMAKQLELNPELFKHYKWGTRSWKRHLSFIRKFTSFTPYEISFRKSLPEWFAVQIKNNPGRNNIMEQLIKRLRELKVELPPIKEVKRLVNSSREKFFKHLYSEAIKNLTPKMKEKMDSCLSSETKQGSYGWLKSPAGKLGMNTILEEVIKLKNVQQMEISRNFYNSLSPKLITRLYNRCKSHNVGHLKTLKKEVRYTLMSVFFYIREMEITDNIIHIFLELIRKIGKKADKAIENNVVSELRKVYGKGKILRKLTLAVTDNPEGTIENTIFPVVSLNTFNKLAEEYNATPEDDYDIYKIKIMREKYARTYRKMIKPILDVLKLNTNNRAYTKLLKGLDIIHSHINKNYRYFPLYEDVPLELLTKKYAALAIEKVGQKERIVKHYFELGILEKVDKMVRCKELWVKNAGKFRNPNADLPINWSENRHEYYKRIETPFDGNIFIETMQERMKEHLSIANNYFSKKRKNDVYIYHSGNSDKGLLRVPKIKKQRERIIIQKIKENVIEHWGVLDLIDVLVETDRQVNFTRFFTSSGQRQILTKEQIKERLLINLFSLGTMNELKRTHKASELNCSYDDLLYFREHYIFADTLREAIVALTNRILEVRNPKIWGNNTTCASDGKQFGAWDQNLIAESNPHYHNKGVMVYWHVEKNSTCIYSQIKRPNSSEVWSMIEGLIKHETEMKIDTNFVDSRGQSEVAFGFCRFLKLKLLPRLKRIKYERFYLPDKDMTGYYPNLKSVLARPIRWDMIRKQYDEMVKHVVAIKEGTASSEAILRRFTSYNNTHPTYKAFIELGKAEKTMFLCRYLTTPLLRGETHSALNVIENWNSVNSFIGYGSKSEFHTNDPVIQELIVLSIHLLQNAVILINTIMIDKIINKMEYFPKMETKDFQALTPLFTSNINPYGNFVLNLLKPSFLEVA